MKCICSMLMIRHVAKDARGEGCFAAVVDPGGGPKGSRSLMLTRLVNSGSCHGLDGVFHRFGRLPREKSVMLLQNLGEGEQGFICLNPNWTLIILLH